MMRAKIFSYSMLAAATAFLTACNTAKVQTWTDPAFEDRPLGNTMVLGIGDSNSKIRQYENLFATRLSELGVAAGSLHTTFQVPEKPDREALETILKSNDIDSIIVTRMLSETERNQMVTTGYYSTPSYSSYWGYYSHSISFYSADISSFREFELETNLYDVESEKLVWSGRMVVYDDRSDLKNMRETIRTVMLELRKNGFID